MDLIKVVESYRGKDRMIRMATYVCMFMGGQGNTPFQAKFRKISAEMAGCRVILRLFDDFAMLMFNVSKGFGLKERNPVLRPLEVLKCMLGQLYYPVEHVAWLRDKEVLPGNSGLLWLSGLVIWVLSLVTEILKCLTSLRINSAKMNHLRKQKHLENAEDRELQSQQTQQITDKLKALAAERRDLILGIIHSSADLVNAVSWLPKGFLWSQKLTPTVNGICGMFATAVMFLRNWPPK